VDTNKFLVGTKFVNFFYQIPYLYLWIPVWYSMIHGIHRDLQDPYENVQSLYKLYKSNTNKLMQNTKHDHIIATADYNITNLIIYTFNN